MEKMRDSSSAISRDNGSASRGADAAEKPSFYDQLLRKYAEDLRALHLPKPEHLDRDALIRVTHHCVKFIDLTSTVLTNEVGREVSLSVKFLWEREVGPSPALHTVFRSTNTRAIRDAYAPLNNFSYTENTAFKALLNGWPSVTSFASNDLLQDLLDKKYENAHENWASFYTSTAVVTIPSASGPDLFPIGFLCADAKGPGLDTQTVRLTLESAAAHLYNILGVLFSTKRDTTPGSKIKTKQLTPVIPCGWRPEASQLVAVNSANQQMFQETLEKIEGVYSSHPMFTGEAPRPLSGFRRAYEASPLQETTMIDEEELVAMAKASDTPAARRYLAVRAAPKLSAEQLKAVLKKLEHTNPEAAGMLSRRAS